MKRFDRNFRMCLMLPLMLLFTAGAAFADKTDDTFDKVNRHLYGIMPEKKEPAPPSLPESRPADPAPAAPAPADPAPTDPAPTDPAPAAPAPAAPESVAVAEITWDFESGDLRGWTANGDAFQYQPTYGDNPTARHRGQPSQHQGNYWIGGYEQCQTPDSRPGAVQGDGPQGTLTSDPFTIQAKSISFLIGGGCDINTERVEILIDGNVVHKVTGKCTETMARVKFDTAKYVGHTAQIRLVDASGGGWGHINFDDVRFEQ
jgi:hypothetical protein